MVSLIALLLIAIEFAIVGSFALNMIQATFRQFIIIQGIFVQLLQILDLMVTFHIFVSFCILNALCLSLPRSF
jgi:hypothetical protein